MEIVLLAGLIVLAGSLVATAAAVRRTQRVLAAARVEVEALTRTVDELVRATQAPSPAPVEQDTDPSQAEYLITSVGVPDDRAADAVSGGQFVSLAAGESLVKVLSLAYGVRRALSAESRNRIGFEIRREVKRSRRQRRRDLKEAKRTLRAEERVQMDAA